MNSPEKGKGLRATTNADPLDTPNTNPASIARCFAAAWEARNGP